MVAAGDGAGHREHRRSDYRLQLRPRDGRDMTSPTSVPLHLLAFEQARTAAAGPRRRHRRATARCARPSSTSPITTSDGADQDSGPDGGADLAGRQPGRRRPRRIVRGLRQPHPGTGRAGRRPAELGHRREAATRGRCRLGRRPGRHEPGVARHHLRAGGRADARPLAPARRRLPAAAGRLGAVRRPRRGRDQLLRRGARHHRRRLAAGPDGQCPLRTARRWRPRAWSASSTTGTSAQQWKRRQRLDTAASNGHAGQQCGAGQQRRARQYGWSATVLEGQPALASGEPPAGGRSGSEPGERGTGGDSRNTRAAALGGDQRAAGDGGRARASRRASTGPRLGRRRRPRARPRRPARPPYRASAAESRTCSESRRQSASGTGVLPIRTPAAPAAAGDAGDADMQQAFISLVAPGAVAAQQRYGVPAAVTIAQAIEESGLGQEPARRRVPQPFRYQGHRPGGQRRAADVRSTRTAAG